MPRDQLVSATAVVHVDRRGWTKHALIPVVLAGAFEGLAWLSGGVWLHLLAVLSAAILIAAWLESPNLIGLTISVEHPYATHNGDITHHQVSIANPTGRTTAGGHLRDHTHGLLDMTMLIPRLGPGESTALTVPRVANGRGVTPGHLVRLTSTGPYGLRISTATAQLMALVVVRPALLDVPPLCLLGPEGGDRARAMPVRHGADVRGLREWRTGDDARQVHWRATARRGTLVVREHEQPRRATLTLLAITGGDAVAWENGVSLLASLALQGVRAGHEVNLFADQREHDSLLGASAEGVLDGCAVLAPAGWPTADLTRRAAEAAGSGGLVTVIAPGLTQQGWARLDEQFGLHGVALASAMDGRPTAPPRPPTHASVARP